jgi:hypothetical protein
MFDYAYGAHGIDWIGLIGLATCYAILSLGTRVQIGQSCVEPSEVTPYSPDGGQQ